MRSVIFSFLFFVGVLPFLLLPAFSQNPDSVSDQKEKLKNIEETIEAKKKNKEAIQQQKRKLYQNLKRLNQKLSNSGKQIRAIEAEITALERQIDQLHYEEAQKRIALHDKQLQLGAVVTPLIYLSNHLPSFATTLPRDALAIAQGYSVMRAVLPPLQQQAATIGTELEALAKIQKNLVQKRDTLLDKKEDHSVTFAQIKSLSAEKETFYKGLAAQSKVTERHIQNLVVQSNSLRQLISRLGDALASVRQNRPDYIRTSLKKGDLLSPTNGNIIGRYRQTSGNGNRSRGITLQTRKEAHIIAPFDGLAVFAGPFEGHQKILIIEHGREYHSILSGLETLYITTGQWLVAGEPIGRMDSQQTKLYLELRRKGQAFNPTGWINFKTKKGLSS